MFQIPFLVLFTVFFLWAIFAGVQQKRGRKKLAKEFNFQFVKKDSTFLEQFSSFHFINNQAERRFVENIVKGQINDIEITLCDFLCDFRRGDIKLSLSEIEKAGEQIFDQTLCILKIPNVNFPSVAVWVKNDEKYQQFFYGTDVVFSKDKEFSEDYQVRGDSEEEIKSLFSEPVREWLKRNRFREVSMKELKRNRFFLKDFSQHICFELHGDKILFHQGETIKLKKIEAFLGLAFELLKLLRESQSS